MRPNRSVVSTRIAAIVLAVVVTIVGVLIVRGMISKNDARENRVSDLACEMGSVSDC